MKVEVGNIYSFKLTSGQEMVAKLVNEDDEHYYLKSPLTIGQGAKGMEFLPMMFTGVMLGDVATRKFAVAMIAEPNENTELAYSESVDPTAILTPKKKIILG